VIQNTTTLGALCVFVVQSATPSTRHPLRRSAYGRFTYDG
jgi:hypothetical protein